MKDYSSAIKYYEELFHNGASEGANNLAILYHDKTKDFKNAERWYKEAMKKENIKSLKGIVSLYYEQKDYVKVSAYLINLITFPNFTKEKVLNRLKNHYKFDDETIKKVMNYNLQCLDFLEDIQVDYYYNPETTSTEAEYHNN